ncbi:beta-1,3-N-acetylglucosaminyltransferase radical fringe-like [Lethenteron reissneri]|uniref:beta-1,3-N-acetylglucosaminyltransferase radical fringe-like n=1 Tax=Lethenteron reissneri TaxID=7753 RepID=UPI002AB7C5A8|nr:beta-1,3-N-acetylglucosaminyltransferase radical fringe-like [Lethenteron reissneri]
MSAWLFLGTFVFTDGEDEELNRELGGHLLQTNCSSAHSRQALSCKMAVELDTFLRGSHKWFCHVDDDTYLNTASLMKLLRRFSHRGDVYLGRPSLDHPMRTQQQQEGAAEFWFATGGAGFCLSRGLTLKMSPWVSGGEFMATADKIRLPDDCTVGFVSEWLLRVPLTHSPLFHSHLEGLAQLPTDSLTSQVSNSLTHLLTHPLTHSLTQLLSHSPSHSHSHSLTHSLTHPLTTVPFSPGGTGSAAH